MSEHELRCTYRLQLGPGLGFAQARELVPYLADLGVSHLYLPPSFQARTGSTHGYDVVDPTSISDELGGEEEFRKLIAAARERGLGIVLDIVPNHMATDERNAYWSDPEKRAKFFDVDAEWKEGDPGPGYRRFFDIDHLAGVRQEDPEVFEETHRLAIQLVRDGLVDGLRIDHPDGMADPGEYLRRLHDAGVEHIWVEKILDPGEQLRDWPVSGTVGYEFLNDAAALFVDRRGEATLTALHAALTGDGREFGEYAFEAKLEQATTTFVAEIDRIRRLGDEPELERKISSLPVYRTYDGGRSEEDREVLDEAGLAGLYEGKSEEWITRFQQTSPPIMAKGVEDTAFYRYVRLLALNDVGGDPSRFGISVGEFHEANLERAKRFPLNLLVTQTHDTKRSGDVRARIGALAGMADAWAQRVRGWCEITEPLRTDGAPDDQERLLIFQTLLGAWPISSERLEGYLEKALREAKRNTTWVDQNTDYEDSVKRFATALLTHPDFLEDFVPFAERVAELGHRSAMGQLLLKLTVPGVPDLYQGDELISLSLVDPDNRRAVDWEKRRALLERVRAGSVELRAPVDVDAAETSTQDEKDAEKLSLVVRALALRRERAASFRGAYTPLDAGPYVCAFLRGDDVCAIAVMRREGLDAEVEIPWLGRRRVGDLTDGRSYALLAR